jgi:aspartyl-tRNA(Asn)/glutamyl-tRNA(Gln) amidotransferase subunit C
MISKEEVEGLASLARLQLAPGEVESLQADISNILDYVGQVSAVSVDAANVTPPLVRNVLRSDTAREEGNIMAGKEEGVKAAFPKKEGAYNVVRKIIQKDE